MKKKETREKQKGITLIALVVTIVVLLILAGVSISMLAGDNGIIRQSQRAKERTKIEEEKEQVKLSYSAVIAGNNGQEVTRKQLEDELKKYDDRITVEDDGDKYNITFPSSNVYTIDKNGKVEEAEKSDVSISLTIKGTKVENPPIPEGFYHVGGSINEGYVISDSEEDNGKGVDAELVGNQFVWVPVEKDQKITAKVESKEEITSIVVTDPSGEDILSEDNEQLGKTYNKEIEPTINGEYKIKVTTSKGETSKTLEVYSLYAQNFWMTDELLLKQVESMYEALGMKLEDLLNSSGMSREEFLAIFKNEYKTSFTEYEDPEDNYKTSVNKNGGFYIGRYEAGDSLANQIRTESKEGTLVTQKNKYVYNWITQTEALTKAEGYAKSVGTNATSSLLTGAAWDRTLGWLYETGNKTIEEIGFDSTSWGNYKDDTFSGTDDLIKTGQFPNTKANNIYDLAGNVEEWTKLYVKNGVKLCLRGGYYGHVGSGMAGLTANKWDEEDPSSCSEYYGFRIGLYL